MGELTSAQAVTTVTPTMRARLRAVMSKCLHTACDGDAGGSDQPFSRLGCLRRGLDP